MTKRMTAEQYLAETLGHAEQAKQDKRRVRGAQRTEIDGIKFDSKSEGERWQQLCLLQEAGEICGLRRQVPIQLEGRDGPIMTDSGKKPRVYVADFVYVDNQLGKMVIEDRKGHETDVFKIKKAILAAQGVHVMVTKVQR